jgi:hypothetical protein
MLRRAGKPGGASCLSPPSHSRRGRLWVCLCLIMSIVGLAAQAQIFDISGRYGLDTVLIPVPVTLIDEIKLDTPAELTLLKFGIESTLDATLTVGNLQLHLNGAMNIAGLERFIVESTIPLGPITIEPEMWFAVPFETVTDINHFTNWVVVPPGYLLFVKTRWTCTASYGGLDFKNLFLIEDVNFPDPGADFAPLFYPVQSQSFRYGDILTITAQPFEGISLSSVTCINADQGANSVKGWSASGRAYASCDGCSWFNETLTLTGLKYSCLSYWLSLYVDPWTVPMLRLRAGGSFSGITGLELSGSFTLFPVTLSGFSFSATVCGCAEASISLSDTFDFQSASISFRAELPLGPMRGTFAWSGTVVAGQGLTGFNVSANVNQGTFTGGLSVAISEQLGFYRLTSFTSRLGLTSTPLAVSFSVSFGRTGLQRAVISVGVVF